jgi:hypothetical protein
MAHGYFDINLMWCGSRIAWRSVQQLPACVSDADDEDRRQL